ncbi:MAG: periplasmic heavy metal sensor [Myxococcales bacterium]|nr:periplasmic heavy metal sensor [Myxococcales bacterium]
MKWKILLLLLAFSLAANAAILVTALRPRPHTGCPGMTPAPVNQEALGLTPEQVAGFERLDQDYYLLRTQVQERLRTLRADLIDCILAPGSEPSPCEEKLLAMNAEQLSLQRQLVENLRQKFDLLSPEQREKYQKTVRQLTGVGGCGCMGCTGSCH